MRTLRVMRFIAAALIGSASAHAQVSDTIDRVVAADGSRADAPQADTRKAPRASVVATRSAKTSGASIPIADWRDPGRGLRPVARWWWPGGAVDPEVIRRQLRAIADAGFGAVELQPLLLGIGADDLASDPRLRSVGEPSFRKLVAGAAAAASDLGLAFDLTLGSGWPGGLPTNKRNAERQLMLATVDVSGPGQFTGPLPPAPDASYRRAVEWVLDVLGPPDLEVSVIALLAARLGPEQAGVPSLEDVRVIARAPSVDRVDWSVPPGDWRIFVFYENSTEHFVMGGAFPGAEADARVVDHLSRRGADALLDGYVAPLLDAIAPGQVREVFVDSFELMGELPFTSDFLAAFEAQTGYDLTPHLPLLFRKGGESKYAEMIDLFGRSGAPLYRDPAPETSQRIREDYEAVRRALFEERFVGRFVDFAQRRGVALRLQAHGGYGDYLDTYALAEVPESEALFGGGSFDFMKLAASAAHIAGRRWASSESFITLRLFGTRLGEGEMRLLAGRAYSAGINRLAFHGVPYPYTRADGEAWYPFSGGFGRILAGPLPMSTWIDADFLAGLPDFNRFLARLSLLMSRGQPVADVAWLRGDPIFADAASIQLGRVEAHQGESDVTGALRARGLVHDRVSRRMLARATAAEGTLRIGDRQYSALVMDPVEIADPVLVETIATLAEAGIPVIALGVLPRRAPGLRDAAARDARVVAATKRLSPHCVISRDAEHLEEVLAQRVRGAVVEPLDEARLSVSLERRRTAGSEIVLVFNESWSATTAHLRFVRGGGALTIWDPSTGTRERIRDSVDAGDRVELELEAAETLLLTLELASTEPRR